MNTKIAIDKTASYRVYAAVSSNLTDAAEKIHRSANPAFGMALTAAGLMGLMLKGQRDKLSLIFKDASGQGEIVVTANAAGEVKGYTNKQDMDFRGGFLTVIKDLGLKEPYVGKIELETGDISKDLAKYFAVSEQQPSAVALAPNGGMIVQVLPNADDEVLSNLEDRLFMIDNIALIIDDGIKSRLPRAEGPRNDTHCDAAENNGHCEERSDAAICQAMLSTIFQDDIRILEEREIKWHCDCSKERMEAALISLGKKDLQTIIEEDGQAELTCQFCRSAYKFSKEELLEILKNA